jgi:hypothetical protein
MKPASPNPPSALSRNDAIRAAYHRILNETTKLTATIERHDLRCTLQREDKTPSEFQSTVHEILSPLFYLSLQSCVGGLNIHFGFQRLEVESEYSFFLSRFLRIVYTYTSVTHTTINIEDCINTDYIIVDCSELYETIEDGNQHFTVKVIPYKPVLRKKRKLQKVA